MKVENKSTINTVEQICARMLTYWILGIVTVAIDDRNDLDCHQFIDANWTDRNCDRLGTPADVLHFHSKLNFFTDSNITTSRRRNFLSAKIIDNVSS